MLGDDQPLTMQKFLTDSLLAFLEGFGMIFSVTTDFLTAY
jgi:hypothetical protein